jgi:hypothetical protein
MLDNEIISVEEKSRYMFWHLHVSVTPDTAGRYVLVIELECFKHSYPKLQNGQTRVALSTSLNIWHKTVHPQK